MKKYLIQNFIKALIIALSVGLSACADRDPHAVKVKLLAGVNAPTDGTPYPTVFAVEGNILGMADLNIDFKKVRIVAVAQGSVADSRALFKLTSINVRLPNERRKIFNIDGWIVGEDGLRGMSGSLMRYPLTASQGDFLSEEQKAKLYSAVQILSGSEATAVFTKSISVSDLQDAIKESEKAAELS